MLNSEKNVEECGARPNGIEPAGKKIFIVVMRLG
jgi:hypothetical protein